jgi:carbonic anhydrase
MVQIKSLTSSLTLLTAVSASCYHGLTARQADGTVKPNSFNYTALGGPLNWFGLNSNNSACSEGKFQSPINIETNTISYATAGSVKMEVPSVQSAKFENLGSGMEVVMPNGTLVINGTSYPLAQFHFHTPSEHRVNDEYFPMECHFVFETKSTYLPICCPLFASSHLSIQPSRVFISLSNPQVSISIYLSISHLLRHLKPKIPTNLYPQAAPSPS